MALTGRLAAAWGVLGVAALLVEAIVRLSVHVWTAVTAHPLGAWEWTLATAWGAAMLIGGWFLLQAGKRETASQQPRARTTHAHAD